MPSTYQPEVAFFELPDGRAVCGRAPFRAQAKMPASGETAFYWNTFYLDDPEPWLVPENGVEIFESVDDMAEALGHSEEVPEIDWKPLEIGGFAALFKRVRAALDSGLLKKAVPAAVWHGERYSGRMRGLFERLAGGPSHLRAYGVFGGGKGFFGATPEVLFRLAEGKATTMALAGTTRLADGGTLANDPKQRDEHAFVVDHLEAQLAVFGKVRRGEPRVMRLGTVAHLLTPLEAEVSPEVTPEELTKALHPTPAVGVAPRSEEALEFLHAMRRDAGVPDSYAAPFGIAHEGVVELLVGIRAVDWDGKAVRIAAGCGVVDASSLEKEWEEALLKCRSVRSVFGI